MFNELTISQAQAKLPELPASLQDEPAVITTENGSPVLIAFSIENFLSFLETAEIVTDDELMARLNRSKKQFEKGKYSDIASVKARLGL